MADEDWESDESYYFHFRASLRIFGVIPNLGEITKTLALPPTSIGRRGDPVERSRRTWIHDMWSYRAPVPEDRPLDVHIQTLWDHIKPHKGYLLGLKERCTVDVFCGYRSNSCTAGFEVSLRSLEMFIELDIPFGVSVVIA